MTQQGNRIEDGLEVEGNATVLVWIETKPCDAGCGRTCEARVNIDKALLELHPPDGRERFIASERAAWRKLLENERLCPDCMATIA